MNNEKIVNEKIKGYPTEILKEIISGNEFKDIYIRSLIIDELELRIGTEAIDAFLDSLR